MCNLCSSAFQLGKYQKAFEHLGNALTFDPNNYKVCGFPLYLSLPIIVMCFDFKSSRGLKAELLSEQFNPNKRSSAVTPAAASLIGCLFLRQRLACSMCLISVPFTPRPSWLQAAWCRPTATSTWPWTSTEWRPAPCRRARPSGTTSACASLEKRNTWLWVEDVAGLCLVCLFGFCLWKDWSWVKKNKKKKILRSEQCQCFDSL